jgi:hypothetical protein
METRELAQKDFERDTAGWGLDFSREKDGTYSDFRTGATFGAYWLGWIAGHDYTKGN